MSLRKLRIYRRSSFVKSGQKKSQRIIKRIHFIRFCTDLIVKIILIIVEHELKLVEYAEKEGSKSMDLKQ